MLVALVALAAASFAQAAAPAASPPPARPAPAAPAPGPMTAAPVLDAAKGARALEAYRKLRGQICVDVLKGERARARLRAIGMADAGPEDLQADSFCRADASTVGTAVASGALVSSGADEVLLSVETFGSAQRESSLALMRDSGKGYQFVQNVVEAARFDARLRLVAPGRRDILVLCDYSGLGGVYPGACGFFGRGRYKKPVTRHRMPTIENPTTEVAVADPDLNPRDDVELLDVGEPCGEFASVDAGKVTAQGDRLVIPLVVQHCIRVPPEDPKTGVCTKRKTQTKQSFDIEYKFDGQNFRRVTPIPREVTAVLNRG